MTRARTEPGSAWWPLFLLLMTTSVGCSKDDGDDTTGAASASAEGGTEEGGGSSGTATTGTSTSTSTATGTSTTTSTSTSTSTSTGTGTGTSTSTSGDSGGGFVTPPDGGANNMCDVYAQDCPDGQKCTAANIGGAPGNYCVPLDPNPQAPGDPCTRDAATGEDNCELGSFCVPDPEPDLMRCIKFCSGSSAMPMCEAPDTCVLGDGGITPICFPTCDPVIQNCEISGWACYPNVGAGEAFICAPDRTAMDSSGDAGASCAAINGCHAGLVCSTGTLVAGCTDPSCCVPYCDISDPDATASCPGVADGEECVSIFTGTPPPGYENVGICILPP